MAQSSSSEAETASPKSAANYVRRSARAIRARDASNGVRTSLFRSERTALIQWAERKGMMVTEDILKSFVYEGSGAEHRVYFDECNKRAVKVTHPNRFGHSTYAPNLGATPAEYLRRLARCNLFFGDDFKILGVIYDGEQIQIVSSQPWIVDDKSNPPDAKDIAAYFKQFGFKAVSTDPNIPLFYNEAYGLLVADAHDNNVIRTVTTGELAQIDVVVGVPGPQVIQEYSLVWPGTIHARV